MPVSWGKIGLPAPRRSAITSPAATPFVWPSRVYYEDTDFSGVVYHANYLRYFERARTEWLRSLDYDAQRLLRDHGIAFTVRHMEIDFFKPARMDEIIEVGVLPILLKRVYFTLEQTASIAGEPIARARVKVVCVNCNNFTPAPLPAVLLDKFGFSPKAPHKNTA